MKGIRYEFIFAIVSTSILLIVDARRTTKITETEFRTVTSTVILSSNFVCVKLESVTGACRHGRGFQIDGHHADESLYHMLRSQFAPTRSLDELKVTSLPTLVIQKEFTPTTAILESSIPSRTTASSGFYYSSIKDMFSSIASGISRISVTITHVITQTLFRTTGITTSFFIKGCTPSPLLYVTCAQSGKEADKKEERLFNLLLDHDGGHRPPPIHHHPHVEIQHVTQTHHVYETQQIQHHQVQILLWNKNRPYVKHATKIEMSTVTAVVTSTTVGLCGKLVNVTGPCRLRRGFWVEDPIVMTFDDNMDSVDDLDSIDVALSPTSILSIETTVAPEGRNHLSNENGDDNRHYLSGSVIQSSSLSTSADFYGHHEGIPDLWRGVKKILGLKASLLKNKFKRKVITLVTTHVSIVTRTTTSYVTAGTKTFFIQLCTPSPFPFDVCVGRKRRSFIAYF